MFPPWPSMHSEGERKEQTMPPSDNDYSLRERKYAKTKIALAQAFVERLKTTRLADISIKEVCESVEVSEGTFYNYFPHKIDLVCFFERLTVLRVLWETKKKEEELPPLELIGYVFDRIAEVIEQPFLFYEIVSIFTMEKVRPDERAGLSEIEKKYAFPECPGIEQIEVIPMEDFLARMLRQARDNGCLREDVDMADATLALLTTLVGVPLAIRMEDFGKLKKFFRSQLALLWKAIGSSS